MRDEKPGFWSRLWGILMKFLLGPGGALLVVVVAVILVSMGFKDIQIGGLLGKLLGRKTKGKAIDVANTVSEDRVDSDGKIIPKGTPDSKGVTQATVVKIEDSGLFTNPKTVKFIPPGEKKAVEIELPDGVKADDVQSVVVMKPEVYAVAVKDSSGIPAKKIDDLIAKYGG